jgi:hypothetical protein
MVSVCVIKCVSFAVIQNTMLHQDYNFIATGCGLEGRGSGVRFPAGAWNFSLLHRVQTSSEVHPASYPMGNGGSFPGGKAAGA